MITLPHQPGRELVRELAHAPGGVWVTCMGRSMEPTIKLGDQVRVEACARVSAGDVVLFEGSRSYVLHRVILAIPGTSWFLHIGDAGSEDGPGLAHRARVIGRAALPRQVPRLSVWRAGMQRLGRALCRQLGKRASSLYQGARRA